MSRVDLILFAGQSNMGGRGIPCQRFPETAPEVIPGAGWEYRPISAPDRLFSIQDPIGALENDPAGIHENRKTGSLVPAFVNAYFSFCGVPVVGVSASKGGSPIREWLPGTPYLTDALSRLDRAAKWLRSSGYAVRHTFALWCQGESDGDERTEKETYFSGFSAMLEEMKRHGVENLLMVRIGRCNVPDDPDRYEEMIAWQEEIAAAFPGVVMVSRAFASMRDRGLMKDAFHYYQAGYNEAGREAGRNAAAWVSSLEAEKRPFKTGSRSGGAE